MLDQQDKKDIGLIVDNSINKLATDILKPAFEGIQGQFNQVEQRLDRVDQRLNKVESTMVTKDYLDEKLADLRGDLVVLMRKEDRKLLSLVDILKQRQLITESDVKHILSLEPFPQLQLK